MKRGISSMIVGGLALAGTLVASAEVQAMPVQPLTAAATASSNIEHVWWRGGYWRGYGWRRPFLGYYGWRRPFLGYYGWRRPVYGYGYGWRGYRRW